MKVRKMSAYLILVTFLFFASTVSPVRAQEPPFANCRLGVGGAYASYIGDFDIAQLNMGQYQNWRTNSDPYLNWGLPADVEFVQTVRVHQDKGDERFGPPRVYASNQYKVRPDLPTIASVAASQPGSLWLIGNEMEKVDWWEEGRWRGQDETLPEVYATAFHEIQDVIKTADPTARIAIGSIVAATPLRLRYLDRVWDSYYTQYGYSMGDDIDVWNIHGFILREVRDSWGADIPAGQRNLGGFLFGANLATVTAAHQNITYFQQFTEAFREWMAAHGERNKPLINTEYGILYKELGEYQFTDQQVNDYLIDTLHYMLTATDAETGLPVDKNRLVQSWFWYSLDDANWNGNLFDPNTKALTTFGTTWRDSVTSPTNPMASQPVHNLLVANLRTKPNPAYVSGGGTATVTLLVDIANSGNTWTATGNSIQVNFWDGVPNLPGSSVIASQAIDDLPGCGGLTTAEAVWPNRPKGSHTWYAEVVPITGETDVGDNIDSSVVFVFGPGAYLPTTPNEFSEP
jgi:hypothetical protein